MRGECVVNRGHKMRGFKHRKTCRIFKIILWKIDVLTPRIARDALNGQGGATLFESASRLVEVLDEDGFVADFVVDEFVDGTGGEEKAVASGAHAVFFPVRDVCSGVGG
jgi:hypothetical protein